MLKKEQPRRRSLNDRLDAELASAESIPVAGISNENPQQQASAAQYAPSPGEGGGGLVAQASSNTSPISVGMGDGGLLTKKATTIMPREVFIALQRYCTMQDMPKHRALYRFLIDGLHAAQIITDDEYHRFQEMAALLTTTYEKK